MLMKFLQYNIICEIAILLEISCLEKYNYRGASRDVDTVIYTYFKG